MVMSDFEIVRDYKQAKDPNGQIKILAELNLCSVQEICDILRKGGIDWRKLPRPRNQKPESASTGTLSTKPTQPKPTFDIAEHTLTASNNNSSAASKGSSSSTGGTDNGIKPKRPYNRKAKNVQAPKDASIDVINYIKTLKEMRTSLLAEVAKIDSTLKEISELCS